MNNEIELNSNDSGFKVPLLTKFVSSAYRGDSPPTRWLIEGKIPRGKVIVVAGEGGVGKSWAVLELFSAINDGGMDHVWGGRVVQKGLPCLILSAEDDRSDIDNRLKTIRSVRDREPAEHGYIIPCAEIGSFTLFQAAYPGGPVEETEAYRWLDETLGRMKALSPTNELGFVGIDTLSSLTSINENDNTDATAVMVGLGRLAAKHDVTVIVLHHFSKSGSARHGIASAGSVRGASGIVNSARLVIGIEHVSDQEAKNALASVDAQSGRVIRMRILKANGNVRRSDVTLAWVDGSGMIDVSDLVEKKSPEKALLSVIKSLIDRGIKVTKSGTKDGIYHHKSDDWPDSILNLGRDKLQCLAQGALDRCLLTVSKEGGLLVADSIFEPQEQGR